MDPQDSLIAAIEFSIGLAGFSGLIFAFRSRSSVASELFRYRAINLVALALGAGSVSFTAVLCSHIFDEPTNWKVSSLDLT